MKSLLVALGFLAALAQSAAADPTVLRFTPLAQSGTAGYDQFYKPWAGKVSAVAPDALRIDIREGTSIANITNVYERVKSDVTHIGFTLFNYVAGKFPLAEVGALPFVAENAEIGTVALWRLYATGMLDAEFDEVKPLMLIALPQSLLHLTKAPKNLNDLSGLRVIGATQMTALSAKYLGTQ